MLASMFSYSPFKNTVSDMSVCYCVTVNTNHHLHFEPPLLLYSPVLFNSVRGGRVNLCTEQANSGKSGHTLSHHSLSLPVINSLSCLTLINNTVAT